MRAAARRKRHAGIRLEKVAEVRSNFAAHIISLRLAALVILAWIEVAAIFTAVHVSVAVGTLIRARDFADDFDFASAAMTNHKTSHQLSWPLGTQRLQRDFTAKFAP